MTESIYKNPFVFEKHGPHFSDYIGICIKHHKDEKGENTEFHHIFPEHKGGTNDRWNKVHLEYELHVEAHRLLMEAFSEDMSMKMSYIFTKSRGSNRGEGNPNFGMTGELHPTFGKEPWNKGLPSEKHPNFGKTGKKRKLVKCEYCGKDFSLAMHNRWHGTKCKEYKIE
jgi:hypothetical protein